MTDPTRKKILYVVLVGAVIFGVYSFSRPRKQYVPGTMAQTVQESEMTAPAAAVQPPVNIAAIEKASWGRDPFRWDTRPQPRPKNVQSVSQPEYAPGWRLSAIVFSNSLPLAIVNGKTVKVGDVVDRAQVVRIDRKKVTLLYNGSSIEIQMSKG